MKEKKRKATIIKENNINENKIKEERNTLKKRYDKKMQETKENIYNTPGENGNKKMKTKEKRRTKRNE